jgi:hypothetical protein
MNKYIIATGFEQQMVRTSHFAHDRSFLDIWGASGSQKVSLMPAPLQKASPMAPAPLRLFLI